MHARNVSIIANFLIISSAVLLGSFAAWVSHSGGGDTKSAYFAFMVPGLVVYVSGLVYAAVAVIRQSFLPIAALALLLLLRYTI